MSARRCSGRGSTRARRRGKVSRAKLDALAAAIPAVLEEAIEAGGSTLRDFASPTASSAISPSSFDVYDREGEPCRGGCGGTVRRIVQGGRSTFYLSQRCQR